MDRLERTRTVLLKWRYCRTKLLPPGGTIPKAPNGMIRIGYDLADIEVAHTRAKTAGKSCDDDLPFGQPRS